MVEGVMDEGTTTGRPEATARAGRRFSVSLGFVGLVALVVSAWGGIVPFWGPAFGYSGDGSGSWYWNLPHAVLALVPGALGVLAGLSIMEARGDSPARGRMSLSAAGLVAVICGAWFVVGPVAWPVINGSRYLATAAPLATLEHWIGYALGPGLILGMCGAFALGWAARHDTPLGASASRSVPTARPGTTRTARRHAHTAA